MTKINWLKKQIKNAGVDPVDGEFLTELIQVVEVVGKELERGAFMGIFRTIAPDADSSSIELRNYALLESHLKNVADFSEAWDELPDGVVLPEFELEVRRVDSSKKRKKFTYDPDRLGQRSKFGGAADDIQGGEGEMHCENCDCAMTFVAQIDSLEHDNKTNPHSVSCTSKHPKWMFGDVGMIYVFYCFHCNEPKATTSCY